MKKKVKGKLSLSRETLIQLERVKGGDLTTASGTCGVSDGLTVCNYSYLFTCNQTMNYCPSVHYQRRCLY